MPALDGRMDDRAPPRPDPTDVGESALVAAAQGGDRRAFERLYRSHARRVAGLVHRLLGPDDDLDEVVQESFVAAWEGLPSLRDPTRFRTWLSKIAIHHVRQRIARRRRWRALAGDLLRGAPATTEPSTGDAVRALAALPVALRLPFVLHHIEGFTVSETAELCGVSAATTKRRCADAMTRLARRRP